ncbi:MAG: TonB-dependent receptor [Alistipes sp.]|nr:TonB-dependent receptor [Alistipes sp.]
MKKLFALILSIFAVCTVSAQVTNSGMNGTVTDQDGQPLIGATVIAVHTASGTEYGTATDLNGRYYIQGMRPGGPYKVTMSYVGCQSVEFTDITLPLGETVTRNGYLKASLDIDEVVVVAEGRNSSMNVHRSGTSTNISKEMMELIPSVNRSMNDLMRLAPQSSTTTNGFAVGGGNYRQSYVTVDGAAFNNAFGIGQNLPANGSPISLDALDQISVSVTPYDVRQSGFTGGAINAVTKSGDNEFRGSVYTYLKSNSLRGTKAGDQTIPVEEAHSYTYGASFGGAIVKNKLFFFVNGEYDDEVTAGPSGICRTSEDQAFGQNGVKRPTVSDMDMMRNFLKEKYNYDPGRYSGYSLKTPGYKLLARMDWNISNDHKLNVRFSRTHSKDSSAPSTSVNPLTANSIYPGNTDLNIGKGQSITSNYAMYFESQRYYTIRDFTSVAAELNSRFLNGRMNNTLRYTFSYQDEPRDNVGGMFPTVHILKDGAPYMAFGPDVFTVGNLRQVATHVITDEVTYNSGDHNIIAGLQFESNDAVNGYQQGGAGFYVFNSMEAFMNGEKPSAFGITHSNSADLKQFQSRMQYRQLSFYVQDEMNLHQNFKLTAGLRFEVPMYPSLANNYNAAYADLDFNGKHYSTDQLPKARLTVSPRVGFNWDMTGERKYVLRGGTGYFIGRMPFVWLVSAVGNSNVGQTSYYYNDAATATGPQPDFHTKVEDILKDLYPNGFDPQTPVAPSSPTILDKNLKMPAAWKSSLAMDIKLPGNIDFTMEGIYSRDYNPTVISNLNYMPAGTPEEIIKGSGDMRGKTQGTYTKYNNFFITNGDNGAYSYSVTAQLHKRFNFGLDVAFSYTHAGARSYGDGIGDQVTSAYKTNTYSRGMVNEHELGYGTYVAPDRILLSLNYRKEYAKHFATNVGLIYEGSQHAFIGGYSYTRFSYTFDGCVTGDGGANSLLFIPASREDLDKWNFLGTETYTAEQQKDDFWAYINQDSYLKTRKGKYTERGGAIMPWHHQVDLHFGQEFFITTKSGKRNTLEFGVDIQNLPNLLSKNWGTYKQIRNTSLLKLNSDGSCQYNMVNNQRNTTTSQTYSSLWSTYRVMFNVRYRFN